MAAPRRADEPSFTQSSRGRIREAVESIIEESASFDMPMVIQSVVSEIDEDPEWRRQVLKESITSHVRAVAGEVLNYRRRNGLPIPVLSGHRKLTPTEVTDYVEREADRFETWAENAGGRYIRLLDMNRSQLKDAARQRVGRVLGDLHHARLLWQIAAGLKDDEQTVGQRYTTEQLARLSATTVLPVTSDHEVIDLLGPARTPRLKGAK